MSNGSYCDRGVICGITGRGMEVDLGSLPDTIKPHTFPAKLWRLVNNPANKAIYWDRYGEIVVIDKRLFEEQVLSPSAIISDSTESFKTIHFSSFVRQLNLYGFKKADSETDLDIKVYRCFYNPNFKRDHPELVARLRRLTLDNKAKIEAGQSVSSRPPKNCCQNFCLDRGDRDKHVRGVSPGGSLQLSPTNHGDIYAYYPNKSQAMKFYSETPVPPQYLIRDHSYTRVTPSSNAVNVQQSLLAQRNCGSQNFTSFSPYNAQYQPGYYPSVCSCYHPNLVAPHMACSCFQAGLGSPQSYHQAGYPVSMSFVGENNQGFQKNETQEAKKHEVSVETIFQIADQFMQTPHSTSLVKVELQEELVPALESSADTCDVTVCDSSSSSIRSNLFCAGSTLVTVSSNHSIVICKEQQECLSISEQMPEEDSIAEVTIDYESDTELVAADSDGDSSQQ